MNCIVCDKLLLGKKIKFCSYKCQNSFSSNNSKIHRSSCVCLSCKITFKGRKNQQFCCRKCYNKYYKKNKKNIKILSSPKYCKVCEKLILNGSSLFCSDRCRCKEEYHRNKSSDKSHKGSHFKKYISDKNKKIIKLLRYCKICDHVLINKQRKFCSEKCYARYKYLENEDKYLTINRNYKLNNPEKIKQYDYSDSNRLWRQNNKDLLNEYNKTWRKTKYHNEPIFKLICLVRGRIRHAMISHSKNKSSIEYLGCTPDELKTYLEKQFTFGMNWKNHGFGWHIDHIIPLASATSVKEVETLLHYTNLQPLWKQDNLRKGSKLNFVYN